MLHRVPDNVSTPRPGIITPLSNGIEWALYDARVGFMSTVLIQGPGQQGLSQVVACKQAGASLIVVTGTTRDAARLELALDARRRRRRSTSAGGRARARCMKATGGKGVDVVLDCTAGAGTTPVLLGIDALKRRAGKMVVQGELAAFPDFPLKKLTEKAITIKQRARPRLPRRRARDRAARVEALPAAPADDARVRPREVDRAIKAVGGEVERRT